MLFTLTLILFLQVELSFYMYQCNSKTSVTVLKLLCDVCNLQIKGASVSEETVVLRRWEVSQKNLVWGFLCKFDNVKTFLTRSLSRVSEGKTSCDSKQRWSGGRIKKKRERFRSGNKQIRPKPLPCLLPKLPYYYITLHTFRSNEGLTLETSASETLNIARFTLFPNTPPSPKDAAPQSPYQRSSLYLSGSCICRADSYGAMQ